MYLEPYTVREVRLHVRHVNDLMHSIDTIDNFNAVNCNSLTYVNEITNGDITGILKSFICEKNKLTQENNEFLKLFR